MKKYLTSAFLIFLCQFAKAQNVGIGTTSPNPYAKLEVADSTGGILIPRLDSDHRNNIPNTVGLLVYDTNKKSFWYNDGSKWVEFAITPIVESKYLNALTQIYLTRGF